MIAEFNPLSLIKIALDIKRAWDKLRLDEKCEIIVDKYELDGCDSQKEFWSKFEKLQDSEKSIFLKCHPDIHEYFKHAERNPGVPYSPRKHYP
ncbi:MAG: hypothetical protein AB4372_23320 [Xenococcus sp. (in: cyanobacteria)]